MRNEGMRGREEYRVVHDDAAGYPDHGVSCGVVFSVFANQV